MIVIGGGVAGLQVAWLLSKHGIHDVLLLEKQERLGGKILTRRLGGWPHELGACYYHQSYLAFLDLCRELGIEPAYVASHRVFLSPELRPISRDERGFSPYGWQRGWPPGQIVAKARCLFEFRRLLRRIEADCEAGNWSDLGLTIRQYLVKHRLQRLSNYIEIIFSSQCYGSLDHTPVYYLSNWLASRFLFNAVLKPHLIGVLPGGFAEVTDRLIEGTSARLVTGAEVTSLRRSRQDVEVHYRREDRDEVAVADLVVSAVPQSLFSRIAEDATDTERELFDGMEWASVVSILLRANAAALGYASFTSRIISRLTAPAGSPRFAVPRCS